MRALFLAAAAFAASAHAQSGDEARIQAALAALREEPEIMIQLDGTEKLGTRTSTTAINAFYKWNPLTPSKTDTVRVDLQEWVNLALTRRICGDGVTLWAHDFQRNAYTSSRYGAYSGAQPEGMRTTLLQELGRASQGQAAHVARLLREVFSGDGAQYRSWYPGAKVTATPGGIHLSMEGRSRAITFLLDESGARPKLVGIDFYDAQRVGSEDRIVTWTLTVHTGYLPASSDYVFVPPTRARAIANPRGPGG